MRTPWKEAEIAALEEGLDWVSFRRLYPERSYDSFEVKRRRVAGGTAGTRRKVNISHMHLFEAAQALNKLTDFLEWVARG